MDHAKDLNSHRLGKVGWKQRVVGWKFEQDKNMQVTSENSKEKGGIETTSSNGEDLYVAFYDNVFRFQSHLAKDMAVSKSC